MSRYEVVGAAVERRPSEALLPDPATDVAQLFRNDDWFASTAQALADLFDPAVEALPAWRGAGAAYSGIDGFREMWLDWLEPWASYHVRIDREELREAVGWQR